MTSWSSQIAIHMILTVPRENLDSKKVFSKCGLRLLAEKDMYCVISRWSQWQQKICTLLEVGDSRLQWLNCMNLNWNCFPILPCYFLKIWLPAIFLQRSKECFRGKDIDRITAMIGETKTYFETSNRLHLSWTSLYMLKNKIWILQKKIDLLVVTSRNYTPMHYFNEILKEKQRLL